MLCLMDVSGSMDERKKDLAKRFFALLYLFLERKYSAVDVVFIRHTETAQEVDEKTFFHDPQSGGTLVMPALSTGAEGDRHALRRSGLERLHRAGLGRRLRRRRCAALRRLSCGLNCCRACVTSPTSTFRRAIPAGGSIGRLTLWQCYETVADAGFAMRKVHDRRDIWPVFRELFARKETVA